MHLVGNGIVVVEKDSFTFESGDTVYRANCTNGNGGLLVVEVPFEVWEKLEVLTAKYDMEIDVFNRGYKIFNRCVGCAEGE